MPWELKMRVLSYLKACLAAEYADAEALNELGNMRLSGELEDELSYALAHQGSMDDDDADGMIDRALAFLSQFKEA